MTDKDFLSVVLLGTFGFFGFVAYSYTVTRVRQQEDEDVQRPGELRAVHRRNGRAYQRAIPQDPAVGGRGHGWTYAEAWTRCTARHLTGTGASTGLHAQIADEDIHAPDRAAQGTGEGGNSDYQDLGLKVDDDDPTDS
jgi:hypothetical protein